MKKTLRTLMMGMMALLGCTALTSCTNDDEPQVAQQEGQKGYVEFTLSRGADTRTAYAANTAGGLDVTWKDGDKMVVNYGLGTANEIIEVFELKSGAGTTTGKFAKSDSNLKDKSGEVSLEYLPGYDDTKEYRDQVIDFSEQSGLLESMGAYDLFMFSATLTNGQISNPKYEAAMAVYHFKAKDINFGVSEAKVDFIFAGGTNAFVWTDEYPKGPITIKNVSLTGGKLDNDLYVAVYASHAPTTLTVGNQTFELPTDNLEAGKMYTFAQEHLKAATPLTIEPTSSDITVTISNLLKLTIEYSVVTVGDETILNSSSETIEIPVPQGSRLQLFGDNAAYAESSSKYTNIQCSAPSKVYGNIMSLISSEGYSTLTAFGDGTLYNFSYLFRGNTGLTDASGLILPATTLADGCYYGMFYDCTSLTVAPELPATTLTKNCYYGMFSECTKLTAAPALKASTLAEGCYSFMFSGCEELTTAPELPATTLTKNCYYGMFYDCTSLTVAPELPAITLVESCYLFMFADCTNLNSVTCLATDISATNCTKDWLSGVAAEGTFTKAADIGEDDWKAAGVPSDWTVKNYGG